jgi:hypothetical protein
MVRVSGGAYVRFRIKIWRIYDNQASTDDDRLFKLF